MCTPSFNLQCLEQCHAILLQRSFFFQSLCNNFFLPHPLETSLIQCQLLLSISALWETVSDLFLPSNLSHKPHSWSAPPLGCLRKISKKCKSLALCCLVSIIGLSKHYFSIVCTFHLGPGSYGSIYSNIAIIKSAVFCSYPPYAYMHYSFNMWWQQITKKALHLNGVL